MKTLLRSLLFLLLVYTITNAQWEEQTSGTTKTLWANSSVDNNVCWMGGDGGLVLRTTNGGTNWTSLGGGAIGTKSVVNLFAWDANLALCTATTSSSTFVYRTSNGGTTWTQVFTQAGGFIENIWLFSETNGFMEGSPVGSRWSLWKTTDGGVTWDSTGLYLPSISNEEGWTSSMYVKGSNIYFGTNNSRVYYSSNNGTSWIAQTMPLTNSWSILFKSPSEGIACGQPEGPVVTTNGGTTWSSMTMPTGFEDVTVITGLDNQLYGFQLNINSRSKIIGSTDYGSSWVAVYTAPAGLYNTSILKARNGDVVWAGRTNGGITKGTNIGLPVQLTTFTATVSSKEVTLNWSTATELNNYGFEIQRKLHGGEFATVAFVKGQGTTTQQNQYSFVDNNLDEGKYFYRLKQVDYDGQYSYSQIVQVDVRMLDKYTLEQNYPNPFNPSTRIGYVLQEKSNAKLTLLN